MRLLNKKPHRTHLIGGAFFFVYAQTIVRQARVTSPPKCRQRATCRAGRLFSLWAWYIFAAMLFPVTLQYNGFISLNKAPYSKIKVLGCGVFILNNRIILPYLTFENKRLSSLLKRSSGDVTKHAGRSLFAFVSDRPHITRNGLQRRVVS